MDISQAQRNTKNSLRDFISAILIMYFGPD